ncbi:MAG TPA: DUF3261 domain-containing protein [Gammaproteobacteria bacterium]|nr:DUF3261 domain-containing protein [Gammaproteobacteria bacterium]
MLRFAILGFLALLATACASMPPGITVPGAGRHPLLPSAVFPRDISVTQSVAISGRYNERFLLQTEVSPAGLSMVGLTGFGQKLFELEYQGDVLTVHPTPFLPGSLVPEKLLADFQLIYWPGVQLHELLMGTGVEMLETASQRRLRRGDSTIIDIAYSPARAIENSLVYRNLEEGYDMRIEVLSASAQ